MRAFATGRVKNSTVQLIVDMGWMDAWCRETFRPYCTLALRRPSFTVLYEHRSQSIPVLFHGGVLCACACVSSNHFISRFCKYCIRNALSHTHRGGVKKMTMFLHTVGTHFFVVFTTQKSIMIFQSGSSIPHARAMCSLPTFCHCPLPRIE
jgi:hypothetical protein